MEENLIYHYTSKGSLFRLLIIDVSYIYRVIESLGPTNTRVYVVAVYFRDQRLATGTGHSIQDAEMNAAANALEASKGNEYLKQFY